MTATHILALDTAPGSDASDSGGLLGEKRCSSARTIFKGYRREAHLMDDVAGIYARESTYLDRYIQLGVAQGRVIAVSFPNAPDEGADDAHELLDRVEAYLQGDRDEFRDVSVALTVPTARRRVLEAVREIPYGEDANVQQVARLTAELNPDDEDDIATVREALADNPTPLFVPDHRVRDGPSAAPPDVEQKLRAVEGL